MTLWGYYTTREVADLLRIKPESVTRMHRRGDIPRGTRVGNSLVFPIKEIREWLVTRPSATWDRKNPRP